MFFQISIDPQVSTWSTSERVRYRRALENLLTARRELKHIVYIPPEEVPKIKHLGPISADSAEVVEWVVGRFAEYEGLRTILSHVVIASAGPSNLKPVQGQTLIEVDLKIFEDTSMIQPSVLMCEDLKDCLFYTVMTEVWLSQRKDMQRLRLCLDPKGGGGTGIGNEFAVVVEKGVTILAIADSDRLCKGAPIADDSPAGLLSRVPLKSGLQRSLHLECRNIENVISDELYKAALAAADSARILDYFDELYALLPDKEWRQHAHLKAGQKMLELNTLPTNCPCRTVWQRYVDELMPNGCPTLGACTKKENCNCIIIAGVGPAAHKQVTVWLRKYRPRRELFELFQHSLFLEEKVAIAISAWGCADGRTIG